jgi:hypothetical protein
MTEDKQPLNYPVTNPDGSVSPAYPFDPTLAERLANLEARVESLERFLGPKAPY